MEGKIQYTFEAKIWQYTGPSSWYFVSLPAGIAREVREHLQWQEEGWGRMKASARIGKTTWETSIWFDKARDTYILPLKAEIRKKEALEVDREIHVTIGI